MAQLNPNFEIDFNDINSYEQIQLINDTQLAKENLLMHRAYKEPADDAIIRNQFSSFTFVDFCPKLFTLKPPSAQHQSAAAAASSSSSSSSIRHYELETFSDLFERINVWLKLNKDWRVVSMETLVFDCTSQFNHLKSSIHANYLPKNTRGLRLFLSPSKSRFSGPQKVGCINVVPRKVSGSYLRGNKSGVEQPPVEYETLEQILARLNELLLTRPIEGRILSVETITLPMVNGYVNTETNYFMDNRLNLLNQRIYSMAADVSSPSTSNASQPQHSEPNNLTSTSDQHQQQQSSINKSAHTLIDILRVYYEFGPMVCGLVNLIDFIPRFYATVDVNEQNQHQQHEEQSGPSDCAPSTSSSSARDGQPGDAQLGDSASSASKSAQFVVGTNPKITATESMTRLIRRSLSWFEAERERVLNESSSASRDDEKLIPDDDDDDDGREDGQHLASRSATRKNSTTRLDLKVCNLQIHSKLMLKNELIQVRPTNAIQRIKTKQMIHERRRTLMKSQPAGDQEILCRLCCPTASRSTPMSTKLPVNEWCSHLIDLSEPYELRFVRLAYIIPVNQTKSRISTCPLALSRLPASSSSGKPSLKVNDDTGRKTATSSSSSSSSSTSTSTDSSSTTSESSTSPEDATRSRQQSQSTSTDEQSANSGQPDEAKDQDAPEVDEADVEEEEEEGEEFDDDDDDEEEEDEVKFVEKLLAQEDNEEYSKQCALKSIRQTNKLHREMEMAHQLKHDSASDYDSSPIGQLTYRLFAPCQLVNSSSCFAINPVNSSSPLARRGSVDLQGPGNSAAGQNNNTFSPVQHQQSSSPVGCLSSENANPASSSLLLPPSSSHDNSSIQPQQQQHRQQIVSFGAFFPALSAQDLISAPPNQAAASQQQQQQQNPSATPTSSASRFTTNEFEPVEAIRRRMEIYVTTNSMKVLAGETLIINLSDHLSCLSTAIEQTVVRASFGQRAPSTWVSVYILYAAVEEPVKQLLEHQKRLAKISEEEGVDGGGQDHHDQRRQQAGKEEAAKEMIPVFDDDFKSIEELKKYQLEQQQLSKSQQQQQQQTATAAGSSKQDQQASTSSASSTIRIEQNPCDSSLTLYNSAYDRTVALPTQPDNHLSHYLEPNEFLGTQNDCIWLDENDLIEAQAFNANNPSQSYRTIDSSAAFKQQAKQQRDSLRQRGKTYRKIGTKSVAKRKSGRRGDNNSQSCSIM